MKNLIWLIIIVIIIVGGFFLFNQPKPASGESIKIGGIFALSGVGTAIGEEELNGATLAVEKINQSG